MESKTIFISLIMLVMTGCASVSTQSDYDHSADFSNLKSYAWVSGTQAKTGDVRIDNSLVDSRVRTAVDNTLASKGFQKQTTGEPDFLVSYHAAIEEKLDVTTIDMPYSTPTVRDLHRGDFQAWPGGSETFVSQYEEGTLLLDVVDPKTKKLIWRGTAKAVVMEKATPEQREARINEAVTKIFEKFPPA